MSAVVADTYAFERPAHEIRRAERAVAFQRGSRHPRHGVAVARRAAPRLPRRVCAERRPRERRLPAGTHRRGIRPNRSPKSGAVRSIHSRAAAASHVKCRHCRDVLEVGERGHGSPRAARSTSAVSARGGSPTACASASTTPRSTSAVTCAPEGPGRNTAGWAVALCDGRFVTVRDAGIATSGTSGRRWPGGHHLIDPRTAAPAHTDITAISVIAQTALHAEILAKGACLIGDGAARSWLEQRGAACHAVVSPAVCPRRLT